MVVVLCTAAAVAQSEMVCLGRVSSVETVGLHQPQLWRLLEEVILWALVRAENCGFGGEFNVLLGNYHGRRYY